jgi:hypothetical protein
MHPESANTIYAGLAFGGLYRSEDGGLSWWPSASGLNPESAISDIIFDPNDSAVMYAADLFSGIYRSEDGGETWLPVNNGLRTRAVNKMEFTSDGKHLYAATEGEGVFRLDMQGQPPRPVSPIAPEPTSAAPEPFEPAPTQPSPATEVPPTSEPPTPEPTGGFIPCPGALAAPLLLLVVSHTIRSYFRVEDAVYEH